MIALVIAKIQNKYFFFLNVHIRMGTVRNFQLIYCLMSLKMLVVLSFAVLCKCGKKCVNELKVASSFVLSSIQKQNKHFCLLVLYLCFILLSNNTFI